MNWVASQSERVGAITDILVALVAFAGAMRAHMLGHFDRMKARVWMSVFGLIAVSAVLGSISHGLEIPEPIHDAIWHVIHLGLGLTVGLFVVGVIHDAWGAAVAQRWLGVMIGMGVAFYLLRMFLPGSFLVFIIYESIAMLFALVLYLRLATRQHAPGAVKISIGILFSLIAAALQVSPKTHLQFIWAFDHNSLFHLAQIPGLAFLSAGVGASFATPRT